MSKLPSVLTTIISPIYSRLDADFSVEKALTLHFKRAVAVSGGGKENVDNIGSASCCVLGMESVFDDVASEELVEVFSPNIVVHVDHVDDATFRGVGDAEREAYFAPLG